MTEKEFVNRVTQICYDSQIEGYEKDDPRRNGFTPHVPVVKEKNGKVNRKITLELPCYATVLSDKEKAILLDEN